MRTKGKRGLKRRGRCLLGWGGRRQRGKGFARRFGHVLSALRPYAGAFEPPDCNS